jgi:hypothetical protein
MAPHQARKQRPAAATRSTAAKPTAHAPHSGIRTVAQATDRWLRICEKEGLNGREPVRALCRWHFQPGGGPDYCRICRDDGLPCARGELGGDGRLCPYREHALISRQEHEAWNVLLACQGQLRLAPSRHVIGIDMAAVLVLATARGCDLAVLSELLPAAEVGLIEALWSDRARDDGP